MLKAVEAGMCTYLGLFWYVHIPRYVQSVFNKFDEIRGCLEAAGNMCM